MTANTMSDVTTAEPCVVNFHMLHKVKLLCNNKACLSITPFLQAIQAIKKTLFMYTRCVWKVMRLIRENSFNWRYVYTHLIFFKMTPLSINTPLPAVLPHVVAGLEVFNWDPFQSIRHSSLHVFNSPKMVSFQAEFEPGKQKKSGGARSGL